MMALPLAAKIAAGIAGGAGVGELMMSDNRPEREKIKKMVQEQKEKETRENEAKKKRESRGMKKGGSVKSSASKRADGIAQRGKTRGKYI